MTQFKTFYDLSQPVYDHCPGWPTYEPTIVRYEATYEQDRFNAEQIRLNSHTGTHLDAPFHFFPQGQTIDQLDVSLFQGEAVIVDLRGIIQAKQGITASHLEPYKDQIHEGSIVLFDTGWNEKRSFDKEYMNDWPYLTGEGAEWLKARKIKGVGIDTLSMGGWYEGTGRPCHEVLLSGGIWILEEISIPDELAKLGSCYLMAFPIKLKGFSGGPARAVGCRLSAVLNHTKTEEIHEKHGSPPFSILPNTGKWREPMNAPTALPKI